MDNALSPQNREKVCYFFLEALPEREKGIVLI